VYVTGEFNDWSESAHPLAGEGNGYWSADVEGAHPGDEYQFVVHNGEQKLWRNDPYARVLSDGYENSIVYSTEFEWNEETFQMPDWNDLVIYEMHVGTFNRGGVEEAPADLRDAIERLSHLQELGVTGIELMPTSEFTGEFSWGYNPSYIFSIENSYGGPQAFKSFIRAAHEIGLAVLLDVVYNHFGPGDLDLWRFDGWSENDKGGIYFYNDWRSDTPWGDTRPHYARDPVRRYIRDNAMMWLQEYRVDGLRWDATAYIRNVYGENDQDSDLPDGWSLMQWVNEEINAQQPWKISIAEDLGNNEWLTKGTGAGGAGFDAQWDTAFARTIREAVIRPNDDERDMHAVRRALLPRYNGGSFDRVIYTESHDEVANGQARVPEEISPGDVGSWWARKRSMLGAALVFTAPGVPLLFQGQEFLEDRWFRDKDPIEWSRKETYAGVFRFYRDLIALRRNRQGTTRGLAGQHVDVHHVNDEDKVIAFHRWEEGGPGDSVIVFPRGGTWNVRLNSDAQTYGEDFEGHPGHQVTAKEGERDGMGYYGELGIGPYSVLILSQDN
jgi:1,4-alpha-glucan branching enzyme